MILQKAAPPPPGAAFMEFVVANHTSNDISCEITRNPALQKNEIPTEYVTKNRRWRHIVPNHSTTIALNHSNTSNRDF